MLKEILIAGFGGQGIMLMGKLLAYGAIHEGLQVTFYPSYGPEMRGGTANCTVVVSDERIGSPVRDRFACLLAMNQASVDKFTPRVREGGTILYNSSLVQSAPSRGDVARIEIRANELAQEIDQPQAANMVAMGALIHLLGVVSAKALTHGLERVLPLYRHDSIPVNSQAIGLGFAAAEEIN